MGRGRSTLRHAMRSWERGRAPGSGNTHFAPHENYAGEHCSIIGAQVALHRRLKDEKERPCARATLADVAVAIAAWAVFGACVVYPCVAVAGVW